MTSILSSPTVTTVQSVKTAPAAPASPLLASQYKRKTMSITQTYYLAHKARGKLSSEAARPDHNLRLLVGHANLLDSLMLELADAEREQESWFNQSVRGASPKADDRHVQWADTVVEDPEEDWQAEDADSDSSSDSDSDISEDEEDDIEMVDVIPLTRVPSKTLASPTPILVDDFEDDDDEEEDFASLTLTRSPSHSAHPPELDHDSDFSEDESMPPSPPTTVLPTFSGKQEQEVTVSEKTFYDDGYYLPARNPARLVSAISVY
ncbi:uncharacterized protein E0L32_011558 [Thyridium curvatum]|uniref:Protein ECM13 n=1 Tax=Thyridium curvatum TaxID=1093900 RepID=A0A507BP40_9PEZI|nr:uncharacterized protein E0L32_011558 [Thyridium curvatum]TPX18520.1 hypothetical protein E0L32_011558 [Thyridium curvatum]